MYNIDVKKGLANRGNCHRLKKIMTKAMEGNDITVGFLGGSITQGACSKTAESCYAYLVYTWWKEKFPKSEIQFVNAGIGGTTSQFGVARVESDLLKYSPDFVVTEFSVNDENTEHFLETYEGLIRKIFKNNREPAILIVNSVRYDDGGNAQEIHNRVGKYYSIPCVSMQSSIYPQIASGDILNADITPDDLHPNDEGHALMASVIVSFLEEIYLEIDKEEEASLFPEEPITKNAYEDSTRYQNDWYSPVLEGFEPDLVPQNHITEFFKKGWTAWKKGDTIKFFVEGTGIAIQFRKSINKPTPIAQVVVDGDAMNKIVLDGNFTEVWGDCLYLETITKHTELKAHTVEITIVEASKEDVVPFYLVSVIGSK